MARPIMVREDHGRPPVAAEGAFASADGRAVAVRRPGPRQELPVEHDVAIRGQRRGTLRRPDEQLAHRHPARAPRRPSTEPGHEGRQVRLVDVEAVDLARPRRVSPTTRIGRHVRVLEEHVEGVEAVAVHAPLGPAADHVELGPLDLLDPPVELRLLGQERVVIELPTARVRRSRPARRTRTPSCSVEAAGRGVDAGRVTPDVPVGVRTLARGARGDEPRVLVAGVVHDQVEDHPDPEAVGLRDEAVEVRLAPEPCIDRPVVAHVIADVPPRRRVDRRQPDRVDAEPVPPEVGEVLDEAAQVARSRLRRCPRSSAGRPGTRPRDATSRRRTGRAGELDAPTVRRPDRRRRASARRAAGSRTARRSAGASRPGDRRRPPLVPGRPDRRVADPPGLREVVDCRQVAGRMTADEREQPGSPVSTISRGFAAWSCGAARRAAIRAHSRRRCDPRRSPVDDASRRRPSRARAGGASGCPRRDRDRRRSRGR